MFSQEVIFGCSPHVWLRLLVSVNTGLMVYASIPTPKARAAREAMRVRLDIGMSHVEKE